MKRVILNPNNTPTEDDFSEYTNIESLTAKLQELRNFDFSNKSPKEISEILNNYLDLMPAVSSLYDPEKFNKFQFYRVRLNVDPEIEDLNLIQTYSYPLPQFCKVNGRANLKNTSVFYCSNHAMTALIESKPKVGQIGYLSFWEGCTTQTMKAGILLPKDIKKENVWRQLTDDLYFHVEKDIKEELNKKAVFYIEKLRFIADLFLTELYPYHITSLVAWEFLYGKSRKDFLVYPSSVNDSYSSNMAIHPNVVDNFMKFKKVIRFKVLAVNGQTYSISTGRVGELFNNNIEWRDATKEELDFSLFPD